ncbi:programmed cell death protein 7 [Cyprinodon tularosa]|uniref:programmed cell death protein 7 n=1 Tax=Cyprinodon tularosa TaxID=77115 RepID=UPI0018E2452F|nr:programmed cell death protein 7 [Cyprinodon tularosa]
MEAFCPRAQAEAPQHHVSGGGIYYPSSEQPNHTPPPWIPPSANFPAPPPGGAAAAFGGSRFPPPYGFGPPPPFGCPPPGHLPGSAPARADCGDGGLLYRGPQHLLQERSSGWEPEPEDEEELQRKRDRRWVARLVGGRGARAPQQPEGGSLPAFREALYGAAGLLSRLQHLCGLLQELLQEAGGGWAESYQMALEAKTELQEELQRLSDPHRLNQLKAKGARIARRRGRSLRAKKELQMEEKLAADLSSEKEASIDNWRSRQVQKEEEKKKELELKRSADAVLCEVRKKQADVKRMQDIMRSLEKLRKLRKEAASRKGISTELQSDEAFSIQLEQLRDVMKKRTQLYSAEENALMVMLEGEQQEERRKEQERRVWKERERQLERRRRVDSILFGEELPADGALRPFVEYYSQAEHSLQALIQIRRDWDAFLVAGDHPDGSSVPQNWVLPDSPSDQTWASALQAAEDDL